MARRAKCQYCGAVEGPSQIPQVGMCPRGHRICENCVIKEWDACPVCATGERHLARPRGDERR
jgi:hypothetical protein